MALRNVSLPNGLTQLCLIKGTPRSLDQISRLELVRHDVKYCSSEIFLDEKARVILKAPPIKSFLKNNFMKLVGWTPSDKEVRGNRILKQLGIETSGVLARAIPLNPFNPYRSLLYSQFINDSMPFSEFLKRYPEAPQRQELLDKVASQLSLMFRHGVSFRDFYFGNILYSEGQLIWIDTEVQKYRLRKQKPRARFIEKKEFMCDRFLRSGGHIEEWERFWKISLE